jgi:ubiquitin carboxyl-terminal hydrolase L5
MEDFGVRNVEVTELWSMDESSLENLVEQYEKVYGLIFLFKWDGSSNNLEINTEEHSKRRRILEVDETPVDLFFARQVIHNACATQAILGVLFNSPTGSTGINLGETLENLKQFMMPLPPDMKGETIGASDVLRTVHNSFAHRDMFALDKEKKYIGSSKEDIFHFIAYGKMSPFCINILTQITCDRTCIYFL